MRAIGLGCFLFLLANCQREVLSDGNTTLIVTSVLTEPYLFVSESDPTEYRGYVADLAEELADIIGFNVRIQIAKDGKFGTVQSNGQFDGMVGELMRHEADLAIAPLTITALRDRVVDFSQPFQMTRIRMLMKKSTASTVTNWEDLLKDDVTVVVLESSSIKEEFRTSTIRVYERIYGKLYSNEGSYVNTIEEGVEKVRNSPATVFVTDGATASYYAASEPCDLVVVGEPWQWATYGVATPLGSPYRARINLAILELREVEHMSALEHKWWLARGTSCPA